MIKPGLVSISFRQLSVEKIIEASVKAGLKGIEWGGDKHVPHGDLNLAEKVREQTLSAGLEIAAYGSYFRFSGDEVSFPEVLNTAKALGAPVIRVWAGREGSAEISPEEYKRIIKETQSAGDLCGEAGIKLTFEYHGGTITDTNKSAGQFMQDVNHQWVNSYWQPPVGMAKEDCLKGIDLISDYFQGVHVFHWYPDFKNRLPLTQGEDLWREYFKKLSSVKNEYWALMEFVKDDSLENLYTDAKTLHKLISP